MEKVELDYLRKQWKDELGYYWDRAQKEIDEYFKMIKDTNCIKATHLKSISKEDFLEESSLDESRLKDPLFIPEILDLLNRIKKINYDVFPDNFISGRYDHKERASDIWNNLIPRYRQVADKVIDFKLSQYNNLYDKPALPKSEKQFIKRNFEKYGLIQYDHHLDLINSIAYHDKFYTILPNLLRTLFENILHDIFRSSLNDRHKTLYFDENNGRVVDFSVLIKLLSQLSQSVFKNEIRETITAKIIKILEDVKKIGNLSIHDVIRKITRSHADEIQDEIDLVLEALLVSYNKLNDADIEIDSERVKIIEEKIGLRKKNNLKKKKKKKTKEVKQIEDYSEIANLMSEIRRLIDNDSLDIINIRNKMDELLLSAKPLIDKRQREALGKAYVLFNNALQNPPMKKTLQALFDVLNIIILGR